MTKYSIALAAVIGLGWLGTQTPDALGASPFGIHFRSGPVHIDVGRVSHSRYGYWDDCYYDRGHYDWHRGYYYRHRNHFHYEPGHWDFHHYGHRHHLDGRRHHRRRH